MLPQLDHDKPVDPIRYFKLFSSPEPKALSLYDGIVVEHVHVRPCTLSNINISETNGPIVLIFYVKHHWGGEGSIRVCATLLQNSGLMAKESFQSYNCKDFLAFHRIPIISEDNVDIN